MRPDGIFASASNTGSRPAPRADCPITARSSTPPSAARPFIAVVAQDQLRTLVNNRQMNPDVRKLVAGEV